MQKSWKAAQGSRKHQSKRCQKDLFCSHIFPGNFKKLQVYSDFIFIANLLKNPWHTKFPKNKYFKKKLYSTKRKYHFSVKPRQNKKV